MFLHTHTFQARDHYGHTPLHKAVMANQESIVKYLVDYFPELIESKDNVRNTNISLNMPSMSNHKKHVVILYGFSYFLRHLYLITHCH